MHEFREYSLWVYIVLLFLLLARGKNKFRDIHFSFNIALISLSS